MRTKRVWWEFLCIYNLQKDQQKLNEKQKVGNGQTNEFNLNSRTVGMFLFVVLSVGIVKFEWQKKKKKIWIFPKESCCYCSFVRDNCGIALMQSIFLSEAIYEKNVFYYI